MDWAHWAGIHAAPTGRHQCCGIAMEYGWDGNRIEASDSTDLYRTTWSNSLLQMPLHRRSICS